VAKAVIVVVAVFIYPVSFSSLPGCLPKIAKPVCHFPNIPADKGQDL
jgi:hypothetical protein